MGFGAPACPNGYENMGSSSGDLKNYALSSCTRATGGVSTIMYFQRAYYDALNNPSSPVCAEFASGMQSMCTEDGGSFADIQSRHSDYCQNPTPEVNAQ